MFAIVAVKNWKKVSYRRQIKTRRISIGSGNRLHYSFDFL